MKKIVPLLFSAILLHALSLAQTSDNRFGRVSEDELQMTGYDKDPDANAVILYEDTRIYYSIEQSIFRIKEYRTRVKILKQEGSKEADVNIYYRSASGMKEIISAIDATSYNLENGKIVKTPLKKQYIFTERIDEDQMLLKFSIPEVRAGTVIEYRYRITSPNITHIPPFRFQHDIPVLCSHMQAEIPEFFKVGVNLKGHHYIDISEDSSTIMFMSSDGKPINYSTRVIKADAQNLPALKNEPFVWCLNDFRSMLDFELTQIAFPGQMIQNYSSTWESVNSLLKKGAFDTACKIGNPFKDEVAAIKARDTIPRTQANAVLKLIQSKIKWNGEYELFSERPRAAATAGSGTSAEINFVLMAALKDAGFKVVPILLSPRHQGRLPYTRPTINGIWNFILRLELGNGEYAYADATDPHSDLNILPTQLLVDRARIYGIDGDDGWCDLSTLTNACQTINMVLTLNPDGTISGKITEEYKNQAALDISNRYTKAQSAEEYTLDIEKEQNIRIENLTIEGIGTSNIRQQYDMSYTPNITDEYIYLNATILPFISTNPFSAQTRTMPIEFPKIQAYNISCSLAIPEGFVVEERPKNSQITANEDALKCRYISRYSDQYVQFNFLFSTNRLIFPATEYEQLRDFFGMVVDLNNNQIVIRRPNNK